MPKISYIYERVGLSEILVISRSIYGGKLLFFNLHSQPVSLVYWLVLSLVAFIVLCEPELYLILNVFPFM